VNAERIDDLRGSSPRVLIADGDAATRAGIRIALQEAEIDVCGESERARELLDSVARLDPDVCLVDVDLPDDGLRAAAEIRDRKAGPEVVMLASTVSEEDFLRAIRFGAMGYLPKTMSPARLPAVVHAVLRGEPAIPRPLVALLMDRSRAQSTGRRLAARNSNGADLTGREWEVLDLMLEGGSTREIASGLRISEITVRRHIGGILRKLHVHSRQDALKLLKSA
jgi:DNA-binding NarL/FixJ family response regulator